MRSPVLISACSKAGCYAVLASLSRRYPPLEGRSPTCYSPVCHSTRGRSHFRVRLACVRHAASVDSEPGSNSRLKPEICSERTNSPSARRLTAYFVSTFRLLARTFPSHPRGNRSPRTDVFAQTRRPTRHHNWLVQPFCQRSKSHVPRKPRNIFCRLSGAFSIRTDLPEGQIRTSSKLVKAIALPEALSTH